ncbi:MAG: hypothetical protein V3V29_01435 [Acidimicrobiia bacterium]
MSDGLPPRYPIQQPPRRGLARRTARATFRKVDAVFSRNGPAFKQLAVSWAGNVAGDTLVAVGLAGTLFFSVPSSEARQEVAFFLLLTIAPFAIVTPLVGGLFSRFRGIYRMTLTLSSLLRTAVAIVMMFGLTTIWLYPLAFGMLVLSRLYGISKSSLLPVSLPQPVALVSANALLARIAILAGAVVLPLGALAVQIDPAVALALSAAFFAISTVTSIGLPNPRTPVPAEGDILDTPWPTRPPAPRRALRLSRLATAGVRLLNGFLLLMLAFEFRDADARALDFAALIGAAGIGYGLASLISPVLERRIREEPMVVAALAVEAAAAFIAAQFFGLAAAAALAAAAGLAWGTAKFAFDALLQATVPTEETGRAFTRSETLFQLAWVVGALVPVGITIDAQIGLAIAGVAALAAQTTFVAGLLVER